MAVRIAVHGHFYQPPRENPWTGEIEEQPGAAPYRDWNERVHAESYRPNAFATITAGYGKTRTVNNFEYLSFNVGPTLLAWMEQADPETYARIIDADHLSRERLGRGNAIAQSFHHTILPLANARDVRTEIRWGLADFRHRFGREAEGMWLPETAANDDTLAALIEEGVSFTILAPDQAHRWRTFEGEWGDGASLDTRLPYRYLHPDGSGRSMVLFFYDGDIARAIAFEQAASSAPAMITLFEQRWAHEPHLVHAATDGETYGHHHEFGDLGLAYALMAEAPRRAIEVTNYASYLDGTPPERQAEIVPGDGTSWSCAHGVGRWSRDCGCSTGGQRGWRQAWREPLRRALDLLNDAAASFFESEGAKVMQDPWAARDHYVEVVVGQTSWTDFAGSHKAGTGNDLRMRSLLEMQRSTMAMFASCGWFFADCGGIETAQNLRYAARAIEMIKDLGGNPPVEEITSILGQAHSNDPSVGTAADVFLSVHAGRVAASYDAERNLEPAPRQS